jgi:hypothetical protein
MNEQSKTSDKPFADSPSTASSTKRRSTWIPVLVLLGVFLVGFVPMWFKSSRLSGELVRAQRQVRLDQMQITFANAALEARRGDYELARQGMANFFSLVTTELDRGVGTALPPAAAADFQPLLTERDDLITLLARGDPASAERLANAYAGFRKTIGN